jgi:hypothetical protein
MPRLSFQMRRAKGAASWAADGVQFDAIEDGALLVEAAGEGGVAHAQFQDGFAGEAEFLQVVEQERMAGVGVLELARVFAAGDGQVEVAGVVEAVAVQGVAQGGADAVGGIGQAVHVADFVAVVGGDGDFLDPGLLGEALEQDFGVEMPFVGVVPKRDGLEEMGAVGAVAGVELVQAHAGEAVLQAGQHDVAEELVARHAALERVGLVDHARAQDHVGAVVDERGEHLGEDFGGILAIGMQHDDDIHAAVDGVLEADLLVAAIALVGPVAQHMQLGIGGLEADGLLDGVVGAAVVDDKRFLDLRPGVRGNAGQGLRNMALRVVGDDEDADFGMSGHVVGSWRPAGLRVPPMGGRCQNKGGRVKPASLRETKRIGACARVRRTGRRSVGGACGSRRGRRGGRPAARGR